MFPFQWFVYVSNCSWLVFTKQLTNFLQSLFCMGCPTPRVITTFYMSLLYFMHPHLEDYRNKLFVNTAPGRHDIQHNATQHNATRHYDTQHNDIQHNDIQHNDTPHNDTQHNIKVIATLTIMTLNTLCWMSFMLSVEKKPIMLSVFMLSVVMLNVVAPAPALVSWSTHVWVLKFRPFNR